MNKIIKKQALWLAFVAYFLPFPLLAQTPTPTLGATDSISFVADRATYDIQNDRITLLGHAKITYRDITVTAGHILFNRKTRQMTAEPTADSSGASTVGLPQFKRGTETISGDKMIYDLGTERGSVKHGRATQLRKYFQGANILMDNSPQALNAIDLSISTCNKDHMHYDFLCQNVRVLQNDQGVGRSVTFRIAQLPIFWIPFFVFPTKQGRQSGLLTPSLGSNSRDGIFVRNIGYYFAPSEYWDATLRGTFREQGGFLLASHFVYAVRNRLSGSVDLDYDRTTGPSSSSHSWRLNLQHQQRLNATTNMRGSGQFTTSSTFNERNSDDLYAYLNQQLRSSFSMDKRWNESGRSIDGSLTYYRDLAKKTNEFRGFPRLSFRQGSRALLGRSEPSTQNPLWYRALRYDFNSNLTHNFTRNPDSIANTGNLTMQSALNLNSQHKPMGWLDLTPRFSLKEQFIQSDADSITRKESYTASVNLGTSAYGIFQTNLGRIKGFRHRFQPRISISYLQNASLVGGTFGLGGTRDWGDPRRNLNFSLNNSLEIKTEHNDDVHRFTLATLNFITGFDLDNAIQKWRDLSTNASIKPNQRIDMRLTMRHELQDREGGFKPRLESFTITSNLRFDGQRDMTSASMDDFQSTAENPFGIEDDLYANASDTTRPWRLGLTHYINYSKTSPTAPASKRSWIKTDIGLNPTRNIRLDYSANLELLPGRSLVAQSLSFYRNLHCWEARLSWYPTGFNKGYYFKINIKDIPQIKFEHRKGGFGI
jgi:hypothetical protein